MSTEKSASDDCELLQLEQGVGTVGPMSINKTSLSNLYAWGCTDLILDEYRKKGICEMFEWQAECLAQVSKFINL